MLYLLAAFLILILVLALLITRGDWMAPEVMMTIAFLVSTLSAIYQLRIWEHDITGKTLVIIALTPLCCLLCGICVRQRLSDISYAPPERRTSITPMSKQGTVICLLIVLLACVATFYQVRRIGGTGSLHEVMMSFRKQNGYGTDLDMKIPGWVSQLQNIASVIGTLTLFNLIAFRREISASTKATNVLVVVFACLASLMTGGRFGTLCMLLGALMMGWIIYLRHHGNPTLTISAIIKVLLGAALVLAAFYFVKDYIGRESDYNLVEYLTHYAGGSIVGLDMYFADPPLPSDIVGKETFYSLIQGLRKLGLTDTPYYIIHHEFRVSNNEGIGNIYTALRDYRYDFGWLGMVVLHVVFCLIMCGLYERLKRNDSQLGLIVFSMMYYTIPMYSISNLFYANIISFGFLIKAVEATVLYYLLFAKVLSARRIGARYFPARRRLAKGKVAC